MQKAIEQAKTVASGNRHIEDRLVSIHDLEARPLSKGKSGKKVRFGRKLLLLPMSKDLSPVTGSIKATPKSVQPIGTGQCSHRVFDKLELIVI